MTTLEMTKEKLQEMSTDDLVTLWNNYQSDIDGDTYLYDNDEYNVNELFPRAWDLLTSLDREYSVYDDYCYIDGYGYLNSIIENDVMDIIDINNLAEWAVEYDIAL